MQHSLSTVTVAFVLFAVAANAARADEFKITPDVIYGHKAGMALTFDVIYPKQPNGAAVLFMVSGAWVSPWSPPENFVKENAPFGLKHFRGLVDHGYTLFIVRHGSS